MLNTQLSSLEIIMHQLHADVLRVAYDALRYDMGWSAEAIDALNTDVRLRLIEMASSPLGAQGREQIETLNAQPPSALTAHAAMTAVVIQTIQLVSSVLADRGMPMTKVGEFQLAFRSRAGLTA